MSMCNAPNVILKNEATDKTWASQCIDTYGIFNDPNCNKHKL